MLKEMDPNLPLFIFGHSMGGSIVSSFFMNNPWLNTAGIMLSAPAVGMNETLDFVKKGFALYVLGELKEFLFTAKINPQRITKSRKLIHTFFADPLITPACGGQQLSFFIRLLY